MIKAKSARITLIMGCGSNEMQYKLETHDMHTEYVGQTILTKEQLIILRKDINNILND
jgi:hypothetical protein